MASANAQFERGGEKKGVEGPDLRTTQEMKDARMKLPLSPAASAGAYIKFGARGDPPA